MYIMCMSVEQLTSLGCEAVDYAIKHALKRDGFEDYGYFERVAIIGRGLEIN